ncbi:hypothetical protein SAMN04487948_101172 [Halogranum amylolyticum]|uniref:Uncharacterized protein n=1 Tax=Halogranum amylolyticum TaxID=660520 RepID=A0A1H8MY46_9EURY|nr:hypothetical protein [Halogranum amylolyticum]SEO22186.1 hypothetical protein SAMN04487948_101172 [Halogranum amylolyticum]
MASRLQRVARGIDDITRAVWDDSGTVTKAVILVVLIVTALAIPVIPIAVVARYVANR